MPPILDPCCGSRMMWFNKQDQRCLFGVALVAFQCLRTSFSREPRLFGVALVNLDAFIQAA